MTKNPINTVDQYIENTPLEVQNILLKIRKIVKDAVPEAIESISHAIPGYSLKSNKHFLFFAAWKNHISIYPIYGDGGDLKERVAPYKKEKDTLQFQLSKEIPYELIEEVVQMKLKEN